MDPSDLDKEQLVEKSDNSSFSSDSSSNSEGIEEVEAVLAGQQHHEDEKVDDLPVIEETKDYTQESEGSQTATEEFKGEPQQDVLEAEPELQKLEMPTSLTGCDLQPTEIAEMQIPRETPLKDAPVQLVNEPEQQLAKQAIVNPLSAPVNLLIEAKQVVPVQQPEVPLEERIREPEAGSHGTQAPLSLSAKPEARPEDGPAKSQEDAKEPPTLKGSLPPVSKMDDRVAAAKQSASSSRVPESGRTSCAKCTLF